MSFFCFSSKGLSCIRHKRAHQMSRRNSSKRRLVAFVLSLAVAVSICARAEEVAVSPSPEVQPATPAPVEAGPVEAGRPPKNEEPPKKEDVSPRGAVELRPFVTTVVPTALGGGLEVLFGGKWEFGVLYGSTPEPYAQWIGEAANEFGDNSAYGGVIEAAFQDNSLVRIHGAYHFRGTPSGWAIALGVSQLKAKGDAEIDEVLAAATGYDFSALKALLILAGRPTTVELESELILAELSSQYTWVLGSHFLVSAQLGIGKVLSADLEIQTGLPAFENSNAGQKFLSSNESELEDIVIEYGLAPTLGIKVAYEF